MVCAPTSSHNNYQVQDSYTLCIIHVFTSLRSRFGIISGYIVAIILMFYFANTQGEWCALYDITTQLILNDSCSGNVYKAWGHVYHSYHTLKLVYLQFG